MFLSFITKIFFISCILFLGGIYGSAGFLGCMRLITVDGNYMLPTDWKLGVCNNN